MPEPPPAPPEAAADDGGTAAPEKPVVALQQRRRWSPSALVWMLLLIGAAFLLSNLHPSFRVWRTRFLSDTTIILQLLYRFFLLKVDYDAYLAVLPACDVDVAAPSGICYIGLRPGAEVACAPQDARFAEPTACFCIILRGFERYGEDQKLLRLCNPEPVICTPPFTNTTVFFGGSDHQILAPADLVLKHGCLPKGLVHLSGQEAARAIVALQLLGRNRTVHISTH